MKKDDLILKYGYDCINNYYSEDSINEEDVKKFIIDSFYEELIRYLSDNDINNNKKELIKNTYLTQLEKYDYKVYDRMDDIILELINNTN